MFSRPTSHFVNQSSTRTLYPQLKNAEGCQQTGPHAPLMELFPFGSALPSMKTTLSADTFTRQNAS